MMKRPFFSTCLWLLFGLFGGSLFALVLNGKVSAGQALTPQPVLATMLTVVNVRSGPGTQFPILDQLASGATAEVTGRTPADRSLWWQIAYPAASNQRAWISGDSDLAQVSSAAYVPVILPLAPPSPLPVLELVVQKSVTDLRTTRFSPDGTLFATASGNNGHFGVKVWRTADGALLHDFAQYTGIVWDVAFSPNGQWLASVSADSNQQGLQIWRVSDGAQVQKLNFPNRTAAFNSLAFSPDGRKLAVGGIDSNPGGVLHGFIWFFDTTTWQVSETLPVPGQNPISLAFTRNGATLVSAGTPDGLVRVWSVNGPPVLLRSFVTGKQGARGVAISPISNLIATAYCAATGVYGCVKGGVNVTRMSDATLLYHFDDIAESVAFSPDGLFLVTGSGANDASLRIRNTADWTLVKTMPLATYAVAFSADGNYLVANNFYQTQVWAFNMPVRRRG